MSNVQITILLRILFESYLYSNLNSSFNEALIVCGTKSANGGLCQVTIEGGVKRM